MTCDHSAGLRLPDGRFFCFACDDAPADLPKRRPIPSNRLRAVPARFGTVPAGRTASEHAAERTAVLASDDTKRAAVVRMSSRMFGGR